MQRLRLSAFLFLWFLFIPTRSFSQTPFLERTLCPPAGKYADYLNTTTDATWVNIFLNLDKGSGKPTAFAEREDLMVQQFTDCFRTSSVCFFIRIAVPIRNICEGLLFPKRIDAEIGTDLRWWLINFYFWRDDLHAVPIDIELYYDDSRKRPIVPKHHKLRQHVARIQGRNFFRLQIFEFNQSKILGSFCLDSFNDCINRDIGWQSIIQIFYPCGEGKVGVSRVTGKTNTYDSYAVVDDDNLLRDFWTQSLLPDCQIECLPVTSHNHPVWRYEDDDRCGLCWNRENQRQTYEQNRCLVYQY